METCVTIRFETIRNNTALKLTKLYESAPESFETIRNNTALKHKKVQSKLEQGVLKPFETTQL